MTAESNEAFAAHMRERRGEPPSPAPPIVPPSRQIERLPPVLPDNTKISVEFLLGLADWFCEQNQRLLAVSLPSESYAILEVELAQLRVVGSPGVTEIKMRTSGGNVDIIRECRLERPSYSWGPW